jgi:TatD DNase family protein
VTLIDTHAHLADAAFDADRDDVLRRAREAGVSIVVEIGEEEAQWAKARALAERFPGVVYWCAGFHPYCADRADAGLTARLAEALRHPACVAVGEIGLDYHRPEPAPEVQRRVFADLARTALAAGKPLVLHCRDAAGEERAQRDTLDILDAVGAPPTSAPVGVAHCFQGTIENARRFVERSLPAAPVPPGKAQRTRPRARGRVRARDALRRFPSGDRRRHHGQRAPPLPVARGRGWPLIFSWHCFILNAR